MCIVKSVTQIELFTVRYLKLTRYFWLKSNVRCNIDDSRSNSLWIFISTVVFMLCLLVFVLFFAWYALWCNFAAWLRIICHSLCLCRYIIASLLTHLCVRCDWLALGLVGVACRVSLPLVPGSFSSGWYSMLSVASSCWTLVLFTDPDMFLIIAVDRSVYSHCSSSQHAWCFIDEGRVRNVH